MSDQMLFLDIIMINENTTIITIILNVSYCASK